MNINDLFLNAEPHFENALDDMYYGYGYNYWFNHYNCNKDLSEDEAKLVWNVAKWVMTEEQFEGVRQFPTFKEAYLLKEKGIPLPSLDDEDYDLY